MPFVALLEVTAVHHTAFPAFHSLDNINTNQTKRLDNNAPQPLTEPIEKRSFSPPSNCAFCCQLFLFSETAKRLPSILQSNTPPTLHDMTRLNVKIDPSPRMMK